MSNFLTTIQRDGYINFYSSLIEITRYDHRQKEAIQNVLKKQPEDISDAWQIEVLSLFSHEYTHFLDITGTIWGLEFILRKHNVINSSDTEEGVGEFSTVFMLNLSEIEVHKKLLKINGRPNLLLCTMTHEAIYDETFGPLIIVKFSNEFSESVEAPLSMLSVLEANAYATEVLIKIRHLESKGDLDGLCFLGSEVRNYLNENEFTEYSLLIILTLKHFDYLSLKECLVFYKNLVRRVLNMGALVLSAISAFLKYTFKNRYIGDAICKDLQRGMSRPVVVFKLILLIHQYINESQVKNDLINLISSDPDELLQIIFSELFGINNFTAMDAMEFDIYYNMIPTDDIHEGKMLLDAAKHNFEIINTGNLSGLCLFDFRLPDCFLSDGAVISAPNRIDFDIEAYFEDQLESQIRLESLYRDTDISKFHIPPADVSHV